jgi:hypothetical protein
MAALTCVGKLHQPAPRLVALARFCVLKVVTGYRTASCRRTRSVMELKKRTLTNLYNPAPGLVRSRAPGAERALAATCG